DLGRVTDIVLSHGHNDHTGGLPAFFARFSQPVRLYAHPGALLPKRVEGEMAGSPYALDQLPEQVQPRLLTKPGVVSEHVMFLGEIPRVYPFEQDRSIGESSSACGCCWEADALMDDTSLALTLSDGVFVVTGCAHAGVCNTVSYAKQVTGQERVCGVLGGFHLFETGDALDQTIRTLGELGVKLAYPAHCTSLAVKSAFVRAMETVEVGVGLTLEWT
ncbi:MAG: MBL fold metallo-hydrolase, partial [Clostridia bacterium]|nr:MBL fold metallo-hydrolase [Clostridia bacterium]